MGALDKRIFSGVAIVSALLFVVSALMLFADGGEVSADGSGIALYILIVSGILSIVYAVGVIMDRPSFVKTLSGVFAAITGLVFMVVPFMGGSAGTVLAVASVLAAVTIIADMLALWVSRVYGAMYVAAVRIGSGGRTSTRMKAIAARKPQSGGEKTRRTVSIESTLGGLRCSAAIPSIASRKLPIVQKKVVFAKK